MRSFIKSSFGMLLLLVATVVVGNPVQAQEPAAGEEPFETREVIPSTADPGLKTAFDSPNVVVMPRGQRRPELVVWLPGTNGKPGGDSMILRMLGAAGFRVVGLMYNNRPTGESLCKERNDAACGGSFREERLNGNAADAPVRNTVEETIDRRLVSLLKYEQQQNPKEGWDLYLAGDHPNWARIIISGHSQGAGHAAYIAKLHEVARVVLFSGGPSGYSAKGTLKVSDWVTLPGKTPVDRWWAEYHEKETVAESKMEGYRTIGVPRAQTFVLTLDVPSTVKATGPVAFHMAVVHDARYLPQWKKMYGIEK